MTETKLTYRQQRFVEVYLQTWNASEAARRAGYKGAADRIGHSLLRKIEIQNQVNARMKELSMQTNEVVYRLTDQAQLNPSEFYIFDDDGMPVGINWKVFRERGHLVKTLKYNRQGVPILEFHDAQAALTLIGKALGLFIDRVDTTQHVNTTEVKIYIPDNNRGDVTSE